MKKGGEEVPFEILEDKKICKRCNSELPLNAEPISEKINEKNEIFCDYCISNPDYNPNIPKSWNKFY